MTAQILGKPWDSISGCKWHSVGCDHCYAKATTAIQQSNRPNGKYKLGFDVTVAHEELLRDNYGNKNPDKNRNPGVYFVNSMADTFQKDVTDDFIQKLFQVMYDNPRHTFQVLTKVPSRMRKMQRNGLIHFPSHIWAGVSVENMTLTNRIDILKSMQVDIKFVMFEPLISSVKGVNLDGIQWAIVGGEKGQYPDYEYRYMQPNWAKEIRDESKRAGCAFTFKQYSCRDNKHGDRLGRLLDGVLHDDHPLFEHEKQAAHFDLFFERV